MEKNTKINRKLTVGIVMLFIGMNFGCKMFVNRIIRRIPKIVIVKVRWISFIFV